MNDLMIVDLKMRLLNSYMAKVLIFKLAHFQIFKSTRHLHIKKKSPAKRPGILYFKLGKGQLFLLNPFGQDNNFIVRSLNNTAFYKQSFLFAGTAATYSYFAIL